MFTNGKLPKGGINNHGIGWMVTFKRYLDRYHDNSSASEYIKMMKAHPDAVMHSGGSLGSITMLILCKIHERAVTVIKNVDGERSANVFLLALETLHSFHEANDSE